MNLARFVLRSLWYYRRTHAAVVAGAAVGVAVVAGSLLVGDSFNGSLRSLALRRLGRTDFALTAPGFFRSALAKDLASQQGFTAAFGDVAAVLAVDAAASTPTSSVRLPHVSVWAVNPSDAPMLGPGPAPALDGRHAAVNQTLANELSLRTGDTLIVNLARASTAPSTSLFGRRSLNDTVERVSLVIARIVPDEGLGGFSLRSDRPRPRNVYVAYDWFARHIGRAGQANVLLVNARSGHGDEEEVRRLNTMLADAVTPEDCGIRLVQQAHGRVISVESLNTVLSSRQVAAAGEAAHACGYRAARVSIYLANTITKVDGESGENGIPYSTIAAVADAAEAGHDVLVQDDGTPVDLNLGTDDILLNTWAAADLGAKVGDTVAVDYYRIGADATLSTDSRRFIVRGIVAMVGAAAQDELIPQFPGITDATSMRQWKPPFPLDLGRIRPKDEAYWQAHRAAPKAFVSPQTAQDLWRRAAQVESPWVTSVRIAADGPQGGVPSVETYSAALRNALKPQDVGLTFRPVRAEALRAAEGASDFASLFLGLSSFLVLAAAMLVGLLLRLSVEMRARDAGIMLAIGFSPGAVARSFLAEGMVHAAIAVLAGIPLAVAYAAGILWTLKTRWVGLLGPFTLDLYVSSSSLVNGAAVGLIIAMAAVAWALWLLRRKTAVVLLAGWRSLHTVEDLRQGRRGATLIASLATAAAAAVLGASIVGNAMKPATAFFLIGGLMLVAMLAAMAAVLTGERPSRPRARQSLSMKSLVLHGARRRRTRSVLTTALLACAAFTLVTVAANRINPTQWDTFSRNGGAGGFAIMADCELPIHVDLGTAAGRQAAGLGDEGAFQGATILSFRVNDGDDASCLNLQQPQSPRIVGVPPALIERGGFAFSQTLPMHDERNPWRLLDVTLDNGCVPVVGDEASVRWILKSGLNGTITVAGAHGPVTLRIVGLLRGSLWQSELLMSEGNLVRLFGDGGGYRRFLVETVPERQTQVMDALREGLEDAGVDVRRTADVLAAYAGVQNTYLAAFQALSGLGLVLGTFAVATVLARNIVERRGELALMLALGFTQRQVVRLVSAETVILIAAGLAIGSVAGLLAAAPHMIQAKADVPWLQLAGTMGGIMAAAIAACVGVTQRAVGPDLLGAIRSE